MYCCCGWKMTGSLHKDPEWQETKDCLSRFMLRGNFSNEQMLHVMGVLIDYYEKNYQHIQECIKRVDLNPTPYMESSNEWLDIWECEPPAYEDIYFITGDNVSHFGQLIGYEKLRKCQFLDFRSYKEYDCDASVDLNERVIKWAKINQP